jgi:cytochrome c-type biogenesis protein CcmH
MTDETPTTSVARLREQLLQLRQLHEAGALSAEAFREASAVLQQQLLDAVMATPPAASTPPVPPLPPAALAPRARQRPLLWLAALGGATAVAVVGYFGTGSPAALGVPPAGFVADGAAPAASAPHALGADAMAGMVEQLAARLKAQPADADGWAMLGRSYTTLGRHDEALAALREALKQRPDDAATLADLADALAMRQGRSLKGEPMKLVQQALARDPDQLKALVLAGTAAFDAGDDAAATRHWQRATAVGPSDSRLVQLARDGLAELQAKGGGSGGVATASPTSAAATLPVAPAAPTSARISGSVRLAAGVRATQAPEATVFVSARDADGAIRMPLAVLRKQVKDLPFSFTLDDTMAMAPQARLSSARRVVVSVRVSASGQAQPQPGDLAGRSPPVALGSSDVVVEIQGADAPAR